MSDAQESLRDALDAVLMFHSGGPWTDEKRLKWRHIVGTDEATTKQLCDHIRRVLAKEEGA